MPEKLRLCVEMKGRLGAILSIVASTEKFLTESVVDSVMISCLNPSVEDNTLCIRYLMISCLNYKFR